MPKPLCKKPYGIVCGTDKTQEWLLPWWWERYSALHDFPVTFCDFGMSEEARQWCQERGEVVVVELDVAKIASLAHPPSQLADRGWLYGQTLEHSRLQWFKKPFACLHSPYEVGLWIDLDCEFIKPVTPLFSFLQPHEELGVVRCHEYRHDSPGVPGILYNSGVLLFRQGSMLIQQWAEAVMKMNHQFLFDDHILSHVIYEQCWKVSELPAVYNWTETSSIHVEMVIMHWTLASGKEYIRRYGGIKTLLEQFHGIS